MENTTQRRTPKEARRAKKRRRRSIVQSLACLVVFCTTYALILPALTLEKPAYCGFKEHKHSDKCYTQELVCEKEEGEGHTHSDACYTEHQNLICGLEESEGHTHTEECYQTYDNLICELEENEEHTHGPECYEQVTELVCTLEETEGHTHTEACYETVRELSCGLEESKGHTHTEKCYKKVLTCKLEEHEHTLACYSNPEADVETQAQWEATLPKEEELTGIWADDLLKVAESQLDYKESDRNYQVVDDDVTMGYTRYGAWYGMPYEDWCAMFIEFCLHYAGIPKADMPRAASCTKWVRLLTEKEMYMKAEDGRPEPGDLVFFDVDKYEGPDHVGIVIEVDEKDGIKTIEGNSGNKVAHREYKWDDKTLYGYGLLPENPDPEVKRQLEEHEPETLDPEEMKELHPEAEETEVSTEESSAEEQKTVEFTGATDTVTVRVEAPEGAFPEGTTMEVTTVAAEDVMDAVTGAVDGEVSHVEAVDIKFIYNEEEIEPELPIRVFMTPVESPQEGTPKIIHVQDDGSAAEIDNVTTPEGEESLQFESDSFSVYALVYTVDLHYEVDGQIYDLSFQGGTSINFLDVVRALHIVEDDETTEADEAAAFVRNISSMEFSTPELLYAGLVEEDTTVADLKTAQNLECTYSEELTEEQIAEMDAAPLAAGDWILVSLRPFDTEESLTVTMKDGEVFTIQITDAHEIPDSSATTVDVNKSYLICYEVDGQYYLLKNDGSVDNSHTPADFENLNSTYCWTFNYVFEEKHLEDTMTYIYYLIRPIDNKTKTIALNADGNQLVQNSNNNVAVVPADGGGFHLIGYNDVKLNFENGQFIADQLPAGNDGIVVHIYEMDTLPTYSYTARSSDEERGTVTIQGGTEHTNDDGSHYYEAESTDDKKNAGTITATPVNHTNDELAWWQQGFGQNKWEFDHWEQDGQPLDRNQYPATIDTNSLPIPFNGSNLVAYFRQNSSYVVPNSEKEPFSFQDMTEWFNDLTTREIPLDKEATKKTAEVYDYENRIYRVDITSKANFETFDGNVDMAFCLDVSNSMKFPSKLVPNTQLRIYQINNSGLWNGSYHDNRNWLDTSRNFNNPYYLIADPNGTATVFKIYYEGGEWRAIDASRPDTNDSSKWFRIGNDFETTWTKGKNSDNKHPFNVGDTDGTYYVIYDAGDNGNNRFYYLNQSFLGATTDLQTIKNTLAVAGAESPQVRVAYNTFFKNLGNQRQNFQTVTPLTVDFTYSAGGGTRPDQAFNDARNFSWQGNDRYVILITDGAPQGIRDDDPDNTTSEDIYNTVRQAATNLKNEDNVKFITIGLSMDDVTSGKQLLYDLADNDKDGNKMFYMAESASDLPNILRQITKTIMDDATVIADITDTVDEAFYMVNKETGLPLHAGDQIDIEGNVTNDPSKVAGVVQSDGKTIKWVNQSVDQQNGWHGTVYVKAKEDLLGGNAVQTNESADVKATKYTLGGQQIPFDQSQVQDKLKSLEVDLPTPRVNVNELTFSQESTEWTVYLGTEVDPKEQLRQMYEAISVKEVVNTDGTLHYPIEPNSIVDDRTSIENRTAETFLLAPEILAAIKQDTTLSEKYVRNNELDWDAFLTDILKPEGVTVPYHKYGVEGEDSNIVITLTKEIKEGEETDLVNGSPHPTTVLTGDDDVPVEKYELTVQYNPDYDHVLPPGQGGDPNNNVDYHTGTFGSMYQGHAAGRETSINTHIIDVFAKGLKIFKMNKEDELLEDAHFTLYRTARSGDDSAQVTTLEGVSGNYFPVATAVTAADGVATFDLIEQLKTGEVYYLVETQAPAGHNLLKTPLPVTLTITDTFIPKPDVDGEPQSEQQTEPMDTYYDWTQKAKLELAKNYSGVTWVDKNNTPLSGEIQADAENGVMYYRVDNSMGYVLPHTGGKGTRGFRLTGTIMIAGTLLLYGCSQRRRRKGVY